MTEKRNGKTVNTPHVGLSEMSYINWEKWYFPVFIGATRDRKRETQNIWCKSPHISSWVV